MSRLLPLLILLFSLPALAADEPPYVPDAMKPWTQWVLHGEEFLGCPFFEGRKAGERANHACAWPGRLELHVRNDGARFRQTWRVLETSDIPLPGNRQYWPLEVRVNEKAMPLQWGGRPVLRLEPGNWTITGQLAWSALPESLPVPHEVGIISLRVNGEEVTQPVHDFAGDLLIRESGAGNKQEQDEVMVEVSRRISDGVPQTMTTQLHVYVSGQAREERLGRVILDGFVPVETSGELPGHIDANGNLVAQVRPGDYEFTFLARAIEPVTELEVPPAFLGADSEIWVYEPAYRFRVSTLEGLPQIDLRETLVPDDWRDLPAFLARPGDVASINERTRSDARINDIVLVRQAWLDFDRSGFTVVDTLTGKMHSDWRLDMQPPYRLEGATAHGERLMVTTRQGSDATGVEYRFASVNLETSARLAPEQAVFPASGWMQIVREMHMKLHLPPATRLIAAFGPDHVRGDWVSQWSLLDMFVGAILVVLAWRLLAPVFAVVLLGAVVIFFHELPVIFWLLFPVFAGIAIVDATGEGKLHTAGKLLRNGGMLLVALVAVPLLATQLRYAVNPQLDGNFLEPQTQYLAETKLAESAPMDIPPPQERARGDESDAEEYAELERVTVTGSRIQNSDLFSRYEPNAVVQAGTEVPEWQWRSATLDWSAPVHPDDTLRLLLVSGWVLASLRIAGVGLFAIFALGLAVRSVPAAKARLAHLTWLRLPVVLLAVGLYSLPTAPPVHADELPRDELLKELHDRLAEPAHCAPQCALVESADIKVQGNRLEIRLRIHAAARVAAPLPGAREHWEPDTVQVNGEPRTWFIRNPDERLAVDLGKGVHDVVLAGSLENAAAVEVPFPLRPGTARASGEGWDIAGIQDGRLGSGSLELVRRRASSSGEEARLQFERAPAYVEVTRHVSFDTDYRVYTDVSRIAPSKGAFTINIPLLPEERVTSTDGEGGGKPVVREDHVIVPFGAGTDAASWHSLLPRAQELTFAASGSKDIRERWKFTFGPIWNFEFEGMLPVQPETDMPGNDYRSFEFWPLPGESLAIHISRPSPVEGRAILVENVSLEERPGAREREGTLEFSVRATRGGQLAVSFPEDVLFGEVRINGRAEPVQADKGRLVVPVAIGETYVHVAWRSPHDMSAHFQSMPVEFDVPRIANVHIGVQRPSDRWILFLDGPLAGPAVLYWAELLVFVMLAFAITRLGLTPLRFHEWLLLGFGLSTWSWTAVVLVALWLHAFRLNDMNLPKRWMFNLRQVSLAVLTVVALVSLIAAIPATLLGSPDMHIAGPASGPYRLAWFADGTSGALPVATIISLPLWIYKLVILAWALWLSIAVPRWIRWAWSGFSRNGLWMGRVTAKS